MKNIQFIVLICFLFFVNILLGQNKQVEKLEKLYSDGNYEKCISSATEYTQKNYKEPIPFYIMALSYFQQYKVTSEKNKEKFLNNATRNAIKGKSKDKENIFSNRFSKEMGELHDTIIKKAEILYNNPNLKESSKSYYENLASLFNDTTLQYVEFFVPKKQEKVNPINPNQTNKGPLNQKDVNGKKQGFWSKKYPNGKLAYEINFKDDIPVGVFKRYHENGKLCVFIKYDEKGGKGPVEYYDEDGKLAASGFFAGKDKDSTWKYFMGGNIMVMQESYKSGKKNGLSRKYYKNGQVAEEKNWIMDVEDGVWRQYFQSGKVLLETKIIKGVRSGLFYKYYEDGQFEIRGKYKDDVMIGKWTYYDADKRTTKEIEYINGRAKNWEELEKEQTEWYKKLEQNKGRILDPANFIGNPQDYLKSVQGGRND